MKSYQCDLLAIGSGPACQRAAIQASKLGKKVIVAEKDPFPGGVSLNSGTIPSKSLREAIIDLTNYYERSFYGVPEDIQEISINDLNYRLNRVLETQRDMLINIFERNQIMLVQGRAEFIDAHRLHLYDENNQVVAEIEAHFIVIGTGSKPRNPKHIPFDNKRILDSTRLLAIDKVPKRMIVLGGGIIGSEYASFFATLGTKVVLIDKRDRILPRVDGEIGHHLQKALTDIGLHFVGQKEIEEVIPKNDRIVVKFKDGATLDSEVLLYAMGRTANVEGLGIEKIGIALDQKGYIPVNALFQTVVPHIYAVGDVIGGPCLASTSMEQGRLAARHAFGAKTHYFPSFFPYGIYTIPEISSCGYTEEQLKELGFRYEVGRAYYYEIARSQIVGGDPGMFKILFHAETLEILGVHIIGRAATEVIHIGQVAMTFKAKIDFFIDQVFNYPTYAEGYRIAALNGINKIKR